MSLNLLPKIQLLQEQIDNLEKSGFFTESEMDRASVSLKSELRKLEVRYAVIKLNRIMKRIGLSKSEALRSANHLSSKYPSELIIYGTNGQGKPFPFQQFFNGVKI